MNSPPKETGALLHAPKAPTQLYRTYAFLLTLQPFRGRKAPIRRGVSCDACVTNRTLGDYSGRSALSGRLWCKRCADFPRQLLLSFGGAR
jgi:hypothetical protein